MNIENVYTKLQNSIIECENGVLEAGSRQHWLKGMADGFRLSLQVLQDEGVVSSAAPDPQIFPFSQGGNNENSQ